MKRSYLVGVVLSILWGFSTNVRAGDDNPCKDDIAKFCAEMEHGDGHVGRCLRDHMNELSAPCKAKVEDFQSRNEGRRAKIREFGEACRDDKQKFCGDVKPGEGRIIDCLNQHQGELSSSCKDKVPSRPK